MKLSEIVSARDAISQQANERISPRLAYQFMRFIKKTASDQEFFEQRKAQIVEDFCVRDVDGNLLRDEVGNFPIMPGKDAEARELLNELGNLEVEDPGVRFTLTQLEELKLSINDMDRLFPFIQEAE